MTDEHKGSGASSASADRAHATTPASPTNPTHQPRMIPQSAMPKPRTVQRRRGEFLGVCWPIPGWLHRTPAWAKVIALVLTSLPVIVVRDAWVNGAVFVLIVLIALTARLPLGRIILPLLRMWPVMLLLVVGNLIFTDVTTAARVATAMLAGVIGASVLILTTSISELLRVFTAAAKPLGWVGVRPETVGLAAALTIRSVSYIADLVGLAADSARARGLERSLRARSVPVVLGTVRYAIDTGSALEARGLVEEPGGTSGE